MLQKSKAHITAGTGVSVSSGEVSIGQDVATTSNVTFNDLDIDGILNVNPTADSDTITIGSTSQNSDGTITLGRSTDTNTIKIGAACCNCQYQNSNH